MIRQAHEENNGGVRLPNGTFQPFGSMRVDLWVANEENQGGILRASAEPTG